VWKRGAVLVVGILKHLPAISVLSSIGKEIHCYDSRETRVNSKLKGGLSSFSVPKKPRGAHYHFDDESIVENVGTVFLFDDVPHPCMSFIPGAIIIGHESLLREALKGRKFYPRAYWRDIAAVEIE